MFSVDALEMKAVRDALMEDPMNLGVGVLHVPTGRIVLRSFERMKNRGGHLELANEHEWAPHECFGFVVARPAHECIMVNLSQLNTQAGTLWMPRGTFRNVLLTLRQCWAGMAVRGFPERTI